MMFNLFNLPLYPTLSPSFSNCLFLNPIPLFFLYCSLSPSISIVLLLSLTDFLPLFFLSLLSLSSCASVYVISLSLSLSPSSALNKIMFFFLYLTLFMCNWTLNFHLNTSLLEVPFHVLGTSRSVLSNSSTYTIHGHNLDQRFI